MVFMIVLKLFCLAVSTVLAEKISSRALLTVEGFLNEIFIEPSVLYTIPQAKPFKY